MKTSLCKQFSKQHANSSSRASQALSPDLASHERQSAIRCNTLCSHSAGLIGPPRAWSPWIALENLTFEPEKSRSTSWAWMLTEWWCQEDFVSPSSKLQKKLPKKMEKSAQTVMSRRVCRSRHYSRSFCFSRRKCWLLPTMEVSSGSTVSQGGLFFHFACSRYGWAGLGC